MGPAGSLSDLLKEKNSATITPRAARLTSIVSPRIKSIFAKRHVREFKRRRSGSNNNPPHTVHFAVVRFKVQSHFCSFFLKALDRRIAEVQLLAQEM
jgi:hypothetical protein